MDRAKANRLSHTRALVYCAFFTALMIVLAQFAIHLPFSPIPVTLGLLGVLLCGCVLGSKLGVVSVLAYICLGLVGLPVFAGVAGTAAIAGVTGGYIVGYIPMVLVAGQANRFSGRKMPLRFVLLAVAVLTCYVLGTAWYSIYTDTNFFAAAAVCVVPFIAWDAVKVALAGVIGFRLNKIRGKKN